MHISFTTRGKQWNRGMPILIGILHGIQIFGGEPNVVSKEFYPDNLEKKTFAIWLLKIYFQNIWRICCLDVDILHRVNNYKPSIWYIRPIYRVRAVWSSPFSSERARRGEGTGHPAAEYFQGTKIERTTLIDPGSPTLISNPTELRQLKTNCRRRLCWWTLWMHESRRVEWRRGRRSVVYKQSFARLPWIQYKIVFGFRTFQALIGQPWSDQVSAQNSSIWLILDGNFLKIKLSPR